MSLLNEFMCGALDIQDIKGETDAEPEYGTASLPDWQMQLNFLHLHLSLVVVVTLLFIYLFVCNYVVSMPEKEKHSTLKRLRLPAVKL